MLGRALEEDSLVREHGTHRGAGRQAYSRAGGAEREHAAGAGETCDVARLARRPDRADRETGDQPRERDARYPSSRRAIVMLIRTVVSW